MSSLSAKKEDGIATPGEGQTSAALAQYQNGVLTWKLRGARSEDTTEGDVIWHTYTLTYSVKLDTTAKDFDEKAEYDTNGTTTLTYMYTNEKGEYVPFGTNPDGSTSYLHSTTLDVPKVTGKRPMVEYKVKYNYWDKAQQAYVTDETASKTESVKLWSEIEVKNDYSKTNYHFNATETGENVVGKHTLSSTTEQYVYNLYYDPDPSAVTVNHHVTKVIVENGQVKEIEQPVATEDLTNVYIGDTFPTITYKDGTITDIQLDNTSVTGDTVEAKKAALAATTLTKTPETPHVVDVYYIVKEAADASYTVNYFYRENSWQLVNGTYQYVQGTYTKDNNKTETANSYAGVTVTPDTGKNKGDYTYVETKFNDTAVTGTSVTLVAGNGNTIDLYYEKDSSPEPAKATVTYEFQAESGQPTLPDAIKNRITGDMATSTGHHVGDTVANALEGNTEITTDYSVATGTKGTWKFREWNQNSLEVEASNNKFIGTWYFVEDTKYGATYVVDKATGVPSNIPPEVTATLGTTLPVDAEKIYVGDNHTVKALPETTQVEDSTNHGTWKLSKWTITENGTEREVEVGSPVAMVAGGLTFTAKWTFTPYDQVNVKYTIQGDCPDDNTVTPGKPADAKVYKHTDVYVADDLSTTDTTRIVDRTVQYGTWTFNGWKYNDVRYQKSNNDKVANVQADVEFIGTWSFVEAAKYGLSYEFTYTGADDPTGDVLTAIKAYKPLDVTTENGGGYYAGSKVQAPSGEGMPVAGTTAVRVKDDNDVIIGSWVFKGWNPADEVTIAAAGSNKFVGTWEYTEADKYPVDFEFTFVDKDNQPIAVGSEYYPSTAVTTAMAKPEKTGNNYFAGSVMQQNEISTNLAAGNSKVYVLSNGTVTTEPNGKIVTAIWTFTGWDNASGLTITGNNDKFTGTWKLERAAEYPVTYVYESGTDGRTLPNDLTANSTVYGISDGQTYVANATATPRDPKATTYQERNAEGLVTGTWTFTPWGNTSLTVQADPTGAQNLFTGIWTYEPTGTVTVRYEWKGDAPEGVTPSITEATGILKGSTVTPGNVAFNGEVPGTKGTVRGTWKFNDDWKTPSGETSVTNVQSDVTFQATWTFTPDNFYTYTLTYVSLGAPLFTKEGSTQDTSYTFPVSYTPTHPSGLANMKFKGWSNEPDALRVNVGNEITANVAKRDLFIYAVWEYEPAFNKGDIDAQKDIVSIGGTLVSELESSYTAKVGDMIEWQITVENKNTADPYLSLSLTDVLSGGDQSLVEIDEANAYYDPTTYNSEMRNQFYFGTEYADETEEQAEEVTGEENGENVDVVVGEDDASTEENTTPDTQDTPDTPDVPDADTPNEPVEEQPEVPEETTTVEPVEDEELSQIEGDQVFQGPQYLVGNLSNFDLFPNEKIVVTVRYVVQGGDQGLTNTVTVTNNETGEDEGGDGSDPVPVLYPNLTVTKTKVDQTQTEAKVGDIIEWTITVTNSGEVDAVGVNVVDDLIDGYVAENVTIAAGATETYYVSYKVQASDIAAGKVQNTGMVTYPKFPGDEDPEKKPFIETTPTGDPEEPDKPTDTEVVYPDLTITKVKADPAQTTARVGDTISWTVRVTNVGKAEVTNAHVTDRWNGETLLNETLSLAANGDYRDFPVSYTVQEGDIGHTIQNTAVVGYYRFEGDELQEKSATERTGTGENDPTTSTEVVGETRVDVTKDAVIRGSILATASVGDVIDFILRVENTGDLPLTNVRVRDPMMTGAIEVDGVGAIADDNGTYTIASIPAHQTVVITYSHTVTAADAASGAVINGVSVSAPNPEDPTRPPVENEDETNTPVNPVTPVTPPTPIIPTPTPIPDTPTPLDPGTTIDDQDVPLAGAVGLNNVDHFAYIIGYEDDTVRPLNNITRAEVATIFFRLMTDDYRSASWSTSNDFADVKAGDWYNNAISTCANAGALSGYPDGSFKPTASITRAEFAAIAARFLDKEQYTDDGVGDFSDTADHWAAAEIRLAAKAGWIRGDGNKFRPNDPITRAEVMTIVNRMLDRIPDKDHMLPDMKKWIDNPEDAWYYEAVQEATNEHDYERSEDGATETWTAILAPRDWKAIETEWAANGGRSPAPVDPAQPVEGEAETEGETETDDAAKQEVKA